MNIKKNIFLIILVLIVAVILTVGITSKNRKADKEESQKTEIEKTMILENGLQINILKEGTGNETKNGNLVSVHYTGTLEDGTKFDSSLDRGIPFSFTLGAGQVIRGWDLGVLGMKVGEKRKLIIPSDLGYGDTGIPGGPIPPKATLIFEVELLKMK